MRSKSKGCKRCQECNLACTSEIPARRRGPPKGYLHLVETRMHELEAVLGVILSLPEPALQQVLQSLLQDDFARGILSHVASSPFGPAAIAQAAARHPAEVISNARPQSEPTNAWQLYALKNYLITVRNLRNPSRLDTSALYQFDSRPSPDDLHTPLSTTLPEAFNSPISTSAASSYSESVTFASMGEQGDDSFWTDWMNSPPQNIPGSANWSNQIISPNAQT